MNKKKTVVVSFRFKRELYDVKSLINFYIKYFNENYQKIFKELHYTLLDKSTNNWKQKSKGGKLTDKALSAFYENIDKIGKNSITFELLTNLDICEYKIKDIDMSINYGEDTFGFLRLNLGFNYSWFQESDVLSLIQKSFAFFEKIKYCVFSGYVISMENTKTPLLYLQGIETENLNNYEKSKLSYWLQNGNREIVDIYWGNIVPSILFSEESISEMKEILGNNNVFKITESLLWFNFPISLGNFNLSKNSNLYSKLYSIFKKNNLVG